jgi:hypothetical protein
MRYLECVRLAMYARRSPAVSSIRRSLPIALLAAVLAVVLLPLSARAGGWAVVTLDSVPQAPHAGQAFSLGFMVRQHGVTPIDAPYGQGAVMTPVLTARNADTGETVAINARKEGSIGHFVVDVAFPSAGSWSWVITPAPFTGTTFEPLTVVPPGAVAPAPPVAASEVTALGAGMPDPLLLRIVGTTLLLTALLLAAISRRHMLGRHFSFHSR